MHRIQIYNPHNSFPYLTVSQKYGGPKLIIPNINRNPLLLYCISNLLQVYARPLIGI